MIVLALDQAYRHTGFAIFKDGVYLEHGSYEVKKKDNEEICYKTFLDELTRLINHYQPNLVLTEKAWLGVNARVHGLISELTGVIRAYCYMNNIDFEVVPVATYRSFFKLKNSKDAVEQFVKSSYPELEIKNSDESDAILLGLWGTKKK